MLYNFHYAVCSVLVLFFLTALYFTKKNPPTRRNYAYLFLLICAWSISISSILFCIAFSFPKNFSIKFLHFIAILYLIFAYSIPVLFYFYAKAIALDENKKISTSHKSKLIIVYVIELILIITSCKTGLIYKISPEGIYSVQYGQLIPYVIMLVCFVPYFIVVVLKSRYTTDYYWQNPASIAFGIECVSVFLNCNMFFFAVFIVGGIVIAFKTYKAIFKKQEIEDIEYWSFFAITVFLTFFAIQFYSMVINKNTSLCVFRYFITLLPFITLMFLYGAKSVIDFIFVKKRFFMLFLSCVALIVFTVPAGMVCVDSLKSTNKGYENVVCFLLEQEDIKNDKTLVAATCGSTWVDFYFTEKGRELPQNIIASHLDLYFDNFFTQSVKDGKRIEDTKVYDIYNWILGFDKIYFYSESYKELNDQKAFMDYVLENYEYKEETIESLIVFTKKA